MTMRITSWDGASGLRRIAASSNTLLDSTRYGKPSRSAQRQRYVAKIVKRTATLFLLLGIFLMTNAGDKSLPQLPTVKFTSGRASPSARDRQMGATAVTMLRMETMGQRGVPTFQGTAGYVTRMSGGVGGRGSEASSYPGYPTRNPAVVALLHTSCCCVAKGAEAWKT